MLAQKFARRSDILPGKKAQEACGARRWYGFSMGKIKRQAGVALSAVNASCYENQDRCKSVSYRPIKPGSLSRYAVAVVSTVALLKPR